jgi:hypothetical protein
MRTQGKTLALVAVGALVAFGGVAEGFGGTPQVAPTEPGQVTTQSAPEPLAAPRQAPPVAPSAASDAAARASRRQDIRSMEVLLTQALQTGAQDLARQLKVSEPNSAFVTGTGRARGFILDGHGIFFDVDVPEMRQSVVWSAQMLELEQQRRDYLRFLADSSPDDPRRKMVEASLRTIVRQMGGAPGEVVIPNPTTNMELIQPGRVTGAVVAEPVSDGNAPRARAAESQAPAASMPPVQPLHDPNELYTDSVKNALIDVMLKFSGPLKIRESEWLTVAASDSEGPQAPGQLQETSRILISIRGSDLAAFQSGKLTREEVLKKVEVKEF